MAVKALIALEVFFGALGIISGLLLMADPSGSLIGLPSSVTMKMPFQNFFLVGLFLFVIYGLYPLFLAHGAWTREEFFFKEITRAGGIHWSWQGGLALMAVLVAWLFIEDLLIGLDYPATYMTIALGLGIFVALIMPSTRRYFRIGVSGNDK